MTNNEFIKQVNDMAPRWLHTEPTLRTMGDEFLVEAMKRLERAEANIKVERDLNIKLQHRVVELEVANKELISQIRELENEIRELEKAAREMTINLTELRRLSRPDVPYSEAALYLQKHGEEIADWMTLANEFLNDFYVMVKFNDIDMTNFVKKEIAKLLKGIK